MEQHQNVWDGVQGAVASVSSNVANNWQNLVRHCGRQLHPWQRNLSSFAAGLQQQLVPLQAAQQQRQQRGHQQHYWAPALAVGAPFKMLSLHMCMGFHTCRSVTVAIFSVTRLSCKHAIMPSCACCMYAQSISFSRRPGNSSSSSSQAGGSSSSNPSSSSSENSLTAQPLFDLGMPKDEVKARLAPIPVYTVANPKNEFVLVAGEVRQSMAGAEYAKQSYCAI
jgi:hypothetical protein